MSVSPKKSNNNVYIPDINSDLPPRHPPILIRQNATWDEEFKLGERKSKVIAIEDTEVNQQAALENEILCYLFAGEYASTQRNFNAIKTLKAISSKLETM